MFDINLIRCIGCRRVKEKCEGGDPCKRCRHLRRPCQFASLATPGARQRTEMSTDSLRPDIVTESRISVDANIQDLVERCNYLERIAKHHHPNLELDVDSLRRHAQRLANTTRQTTDRSRNSPSLEEGALALDEEKCTVDPVDESVARKLYKPLRRCIDSSGQTIPASSLTGIFPCASSDTSKTWALQKGYRCVMTSEHLVYTFD